MQDGSLYRRPCGGDSGYCDVCGETMGEGPDACLGWIPGVWSACCGHGGASRPYVTIGKPPDCLILHDLAAHVFFTLVARHDAPPFEEPDHE